ncbi:MAG: SIMPL domain-containing protein [Pseudomonadota bacterium]
MRALAFCLLLLAVPAAAHDAVQTRLTLQATATREVADDRFVAHLEGRGEAPTAAAAQAELNERMAEALALLEAAPALEIETASYSVRAVEREGQPRRWIAAQGVRIETDDADTLLERVGELQSLGMAVGQLGSRLAPATERELHEALLPEAIAALRTRAEQAAAALGLSFSHFSDVNLDGTPTPRPVRLEAVAMDAMAVRAAPPVIASGRTTVRVGVAATAILSP